MPGCSRSWQVCFGCTAAADVVMLPFALTCDAAPPKQEPKAPCSCKVYTWALNFWGLCICTIELQGAFGRSLAPFQDPRLRTPDPNPQTTNVLEVTTSGGTGRSTTTPTHEGHVRGLSDSVQRGSEQGSPAQSRKKRKPDSPAKRSIRDILRDSRI